MTEIKFLVPMCSQKRDILSMQSGTIFGQESPCGRQCDRLHIPLRCQSGQEEVRRRDCVLQFVDKEIEEWRGRRRGFSMWKEGGVCIPGEIVPERFQKAHGV